MAQAKNWIGTSYLSTFSIPEEEVVYAVYQRERCPSTLREHWQFFVMFKRKKRLNGVKALIGEAHLEIARHLIKSREYCMKEDTRLSSPIEIGTFISTVTDVHTLLKRCRPLTLLEERPSLWRSYRTLEAIHCAQLKPRKNPTSVVFFTGATGVGKTKIASRIADYVGDAGVYWLSTAPWWQGYQQEGLVIVDEVREIEAKTWLRLGDRTPFKVPYKGGSTEFDSRMILGTSNLSLEQMLTGVDEATRAALRRRILEIKF